jgi:hypothetical protein
LVISFQYVSAYDSDIWVIYSYAVAIGRELYVRCYSVEIEWLLEGHKHFQTLIIMLQEDDWEQTVAETIPISTSYTYLTVSNPCVTHVSCKAIKMTPVQKLYDCHCMRCPQPVSPVKPRSVKDSNNKWSTLFAAIDNWNRYSWHP